MTPRTPTPRPRRLRAIRILLAVLAVVLGLSACAATSDESSNQTEAAAPQAGAAQPAGQGGVVGDPAAGAEDPGADNAAEGAEAAPAGDSGGIAEGVAGIGADVSGRRVVTVDIDVEAADIAEAAQAARAIAVRAGGYVSNEFTTGGEDPSAQVTIRVPVDQTDAVIADVASIGNEVSRSVQANDVEATLVDLESRVATAEASIQRLRSLLADAQDLSDIILIEGELSRREADLESIEAQRAGLADQAALSTITVTLTRPEPGPGFADGFLEGLRNGWEALQAGTGALLVVIGALLPFAVVLGLLAWLIVAIVRRNSRRRRTPVPAVVAPQPTAPQPTAPTAGNQPPTATG